MPTRSRICSSGFAVVAAACSLPLPMAAQVQLDLVPYGGRYVPSSVLVPASSVKQKPSFTLGMRVTLWLPGSTGIEGTVGHASSSVSPPARDSAADVTSGTLKVLVRLRPPGPVAFHLGGGFGLVAHGGDAFIYEPTTTFFSWIVNAGAVFNVGLGPWKAVRLDVEDYLYDTQFDVCARYTGRSAFCAAMNSGGVVSTATRSLQKDLVWSLGLTFH
jgi:hypothetical protein